MRTSIGFHFLAISTLGSAAVVRTNHVARSGCTISGTMTFVNCRAGPSRSEEVVTRYLPDDVVEIRCIRDGEAIDGEKYVLPLFIVGRVLERGGGLPREMVATDRNKHSRAWGYVPTQSGCWVPIRWTDLGCKSKYFLGLVVLR